MDAVAVYRVPVFAPVSVELMEAVEEVRSAAEQDGRAMDESLGRLLERWEVG
jgi:thiamine biosynthesis lipoprotein ApbE